MLLKVLRWNAVLLLEESAFHGQTMALRARSTKRVPGFKVFKARKSVQIAPKAVCPIHRADVRVISGGKCGGLAVAAGLGQTRLNIFK